MTLDTNKDTTKYVRTGSALRERCPGTPIHLPGEPNYERARLPWNTAVDLRPAAVAEPTSPDQVSQIVTAAGQLGLRVAPQSTGHNAGPLTQHDLSDTVLVKTSSMAAITIHPSTATARVESGALWGAVVQAAGHHGLACLHGSSPDVGVAGYCLGGGVSFYARQLGLATNAVTAAEVVLADGSLVRADANRHGDLFWALRGGGGNFGIVTALEFTLFPIRSVWAGMMVWDLRHAEKVVRRWARWTAEAPEDVTTSLRVLNLPNLPELPAAVRGRSVVCIDGAVISDEPRGQLVLAALRKLRPQFDTFAAVAPTSLTRLHMDPEGPTPVVGRSALLSELPDDAATAYLEAVGPGSGNKLLTAELRQLGGALGRPHPGGGALSHLEGRYLLFGAGVADTPWNTRRATSDSQALVRAMRPWSNGRHYLNFAENPASARAGFPDLSWARLARVRRTYDPEALFVANHSIPSVDGAPWQPSSAARLA